jgi:hypothetical protein
MSKDLVTIDSPKSGKGQFLVYEAEDGRVKIDVRLEDETVWLTQQLMADLFQTTKQNIGQHLKNIFSEGELLEDPVVRKFFTTATDGKKYKTNFYNMDATLRKFRIVQKEGQRNVTRIVGFYNLDMIISVGRRGKKK